jgi:Xaa-Pro aminopeptidase
LRELTEVGLTVRDTDLRLVHRKEFADSVSGSVTKLTTWLRRPADSPLLPGHITSNEPGFYEEGSFGRGGLTMVRRSKPNHLRSPNCRLVLTSLTTRTLSNRNSQKLTTWLRRPADSPLLPGHITSNEPGFYEEGSFGIRLESVLVVKVPADEAKSSAFASFG